MTAIKCCWCDDPATVDLVVDFPDPIDTDSTVEARDPACLSCGQSWMPDHGGRLEMRPAPDLGDFDYDDVSISADEGAGVRISLPHGVTVRVLTRDIPDLVRRLQTAHSLSLGRDGVIHLVH